jgi:GNAT superfamily N-acetyltransferase
MDNITYHRATASDIQLLVDYRVEFLIDFMGPQTQEDIDGLRKELEQYFSHTLVDNSYICWYAKADDKIVGIGGMIIRQMPGNFKNPSGKKGYILNMYTIPEYRKRGIGSTILEKLQTTAKETGITSFELHATKQGEPVYVKNGFKIHNEPTYRKY